jgi:hypothetical protein
LETYFFHLRDGKDVLLDPEGRELPSLDAVASAALFEARAIVGADAMAGKIVLNQTIEVEDRHGKIVHRLAFTDAVHVKGPHDPGRP